MRTEQNTILSKLCDKDPHNVPRIPKANNHDGTVILLPARFIRYIHTITGCLPVRRDRCLRLAGLELTSLVEGHVGVAATF